MKSLRPALLSSLFVALTALFPVPAKGVGAAGDTDWPEGAMVSVQLKLTANVGQDEAPRVSGDLIVTNPSNAALTIQKPTNRLVLAFLVFDALGNPVAPTSVGKTDPDFETLNLAPHESFTHHLEGLDFVTGSAHQTYAFRRGQAYRVIAVYRAAGPHGPGFTSYEAKLQIP